MRYLIIFLIHCYRFIIPEHKRRTCLFKESCSFYVERIAKETGFVPALRALWERIHRCRKGYHFEFNTEKEAWQLVCIDGSRISEPDFSSQVAEELEIIVPRLNSIQAKISYCKIEE